jgi:hypothetical protein
VAFGKGECLVRVEHEGDVHPAADTEDVLHDQRRVRVVIDDQPGAGSPARWYQVLLIQSSLGASISSFELDARVG